jgi:hypothetical protein
VILHEIHDLEARTLLVDATVLDRNLRKWRRTAKSFLFIFIKNCIPGEIAKFAAESISSLE